MYNDDKDNKMCVDVKIYVLSDYYVMSSYGIRCIYEFVYILNSKLGLDAYVVYCRDQFSSLEPIPEKYRMFAVSFDEVCVKDSDIVIYPDSVLGRAVHNPLNAKKVVRWLLNRSYVLTGDLTNYSDTDLIVSYSNYVNKDLPQLFFLIDERELFERIRKSCKHDKDTVSVYFGKVAPNLIKQKYETVKRILSAYKHINIITRNNVSRTEALELISNSDLLISYDALSNIHYESMLIGTPVILLDKSYIVDDVDFNVSDEGYCTDIEEVDRVRKKIDKVYDDYCNYLNRQKQNLESAITFIFSELNNISENPKANREKNEQLKKEDQKLLECTYKIKNICSVYDIPFKTATMLGIDCRKYVKKKIRKTLKKIIVTIGLYPVYKRIMREKRK